MENFMEEPKKRKQLKNGRSKLLNYNPIMLQSLIQAKGFKPAQLAELIGYDKGYLSKAMNKGKIGENCVILLKERYGILPQQYDVEGYTADVFKTDVRQKILNRLTKTESASKQLITVQIQVDREQLTEIIRGAVLEAFESL